MTSRSDPGMAGDASLDEGAARTDRPVPRALASWLAQGFVGPDAPLIVACSGGADSLALALAMPVVARNRRLIAATVDHGLQTGSAERARDVAELLRDNGFDRVEILTVVVDGAGGPEAAARDARYRALSGLVEDIGSGAGTAPAVLLAHTAEDQAETVLLGLGRGSGPRSIAGMRPWRAPWGRPLLRTRRADTEAACAAAGLRPWQDPHNRDPSFTRVRLRGEVIPLLDDVLGGGVVSALGRTAELLTDDLDALDDLAVAVAGAALAADGSLVVASLVDHPAAVRRRVLRTWAGRAAGTTPPDATALSDIPLTDANVLSDAAALPDAAAPPDAALHASGRSQGIGPASRQLTADHLYRLDALLTDGRSGQAVRLPGGADVVRRRGRLTLADPATSDRQARSGEPPARSGEPQ